MQHLPPTYPVPGCCPQSALVLYQVKPQGLLDRHTAVTSPGASIGAACGPSLFTHYLWPCPASQFASLSPAEEWKKATQAVSISAVVSGQWAAFATTDLPSAWTQQLVERGSSSVTSACWCQWGWLCGHPRLGLLKVSVGVLLRALCYNCVLPCAASLHLLNFAVKEQQAASWQGTVCSFLVYLPIPNDQILGNNWHLPDFAVFMYPLTNEVSSNGSEFSWNFDSTQVCLELLVAFMPSSPKKETSQRCCTNMDFSCPS